MGALVAATLVALREHRRAAGLADELSAARTEATLLERRDDHTGLFNSRFFVESLTREIERARTYDRPVALALASVDDVAPDEVEASMRTPGRGDRRQRARRSTWPAAWAPPSSA